MHRLTFRLLLAALLAAPLLAQPERASAFVSIPLVEVDNPQDCTSFDPAFVGCVEETFHIARFEITNAQYAEFLNAMASEGDPFGLYATEAPDGSLLQILRSGSGTASDPFVYTVRESPGLDIPSWPVNWIDWFRAARFVNWLENGQPTAAEMPDATELGTYDMSQMFPSRNPDAFWVLPTLDEWYKAGYHDPENPDADLMEVDDYWTFPVQSHSIVCELPPGGPTSANCDAQDPLKNPFPVGSYTEAPSHYGTFDQAGNIREWAEDLLDISGSGLATFGGFSVGGSFNTPLGDVDARIGFPSDELDVALNDAEQASRDRGFRVAFVPEPPAELLRTAALATIAAPAAVARLRRVRSRRA